MCVARFFGINDDYLLDTYLILSYIKYNNRDNRRTPFVSPADKFIEAQKEQIQFSDKIFDGMQASTSP